MISRKKVYILAKKLARLSFDEITGVIDYERVYKVLEMLYELREEASHLLQRKYQYFLELEQANRVMQIEYTDGADVEHIHARIEASMQKKFQFKAIQTPELISGFRVTLGDQIWERSIRSDLDAIRRC